MDLKQTVQLYTEMGYQKLKPGQAPNLGDVAKFDLHIATVVDYSPDGEPIIFGHDGRLGMWSGTRSQYEASPRERYGPFPYRFEFYYSPPQAQQVRVNSTVEEYRRLLTRYGAQGVVFPAPPPRRGRKYRAPTSA